jgi:integrase
MLGLRISKTLATRVSDADFTKKIIRVRQSVDAATRTIAGTTSAAGSADLPMPKQLEQRLRLSDKARGQERTVVCESTRTAILGKQQTNCERMSYTAETVRNRRGGWHAMRHGAASSLLADGAAPAVVQRTLRHSNAKITLEHYSHIIGDAQRTTAENRSARLVNSLESLENGILLESVTIRAVESVGLVGTAGVQPAT